MYDATAGGTKPSMDRPDARRCRTSVEETGAVGASTRMIRTDVTARRLARRSCARRCRQELPERAGRAPGPRHRDEVAAVEDRRVVPPAREVPERVGAGDEEHRRRGPRPRPPADRASCSCRTARRCGARGRTRPACGSPCTASSTIASRSRGRRVRRRAVRRQIGRHELDAIESERVAPPRARRRDDRRGSGSNVPPSTPRRISRLPRSCARPPRATSLR